MAATGTTGIAEAPEFLPAKEASFLSASKPLKVPITKIPITLPDVLELCRRPWVVRKGFMYAECCLPQGLAVLDGHSSRSVGQACRTGSVTIRLALLLLVASVSGCGSKPKAPPAASSTSPASSNSSTTGAEPSKGDTAAKSPAESTGSPHVRMDGEGRKWIGDIPYDVFFDDPLAVAANTTSTGAPEPATMTASKNGEGAPAAPAATPSSTESAPAETAGAGGGWDGMISMEQINEETKRIRNHLTASLQSQGTYNGGYKELQVDGALAAALAEIVAQHSGSTSWKKNHRYLRHYGQQLNGAAKALGKESYDASQVAAEGITAVLNGNLPGDAGDPPATVPFAEAANRGSLMIRMEKAFEWMRANVNSESVFNKEIDQIQQESSLLSALGQFVTDESYDSAGEDDYKRPAQTLIQGGRDAAAAAAEKTYPKFQQALDKIKKSCDECHLSYRNG